jgi:hypothetical protein
MNTRIDGRDHRLNDMALRIGKVLNGEDLFDVACAAALITAYALGRGARNVTERRKLVEKVVTFIRAESEKASLEHE